MKSVFVIVSSIVLCFFSLHNNAQPGTIDYSFNIGTGANAVINSAKVQSDNKIIIGGGFTTFNEATRNRITRLHSNGNIDNSFSIGSGCNDAVQTIALQSDGKIIIGGSFTQYNGTNRRHIARLNTDGSLDTSFNIGTGANFPILAVAIQNDGKIIIGGGFTSFNGTNINRILRLNSNGSIDSSFNVGTGFDNTIHSLNIQNDGKIIIAGEFSNYNNNTSNRIIRVNDNGSVDTTFSIGNGANNTIFTIHNQPDGKIILGGLFTTFNSNTTNYLVRLNSNGSIDSTFNVGIGANNFIRSIGFQTNNKIVVGGSFTNFNNSLINRLARIENTGSSDTSFLTATGSGANNTINSIAILADGGILLVGNFSSFNGAAINRIVKINGDEVLSAPILKSDDVSLFPNPVTNILYISDEAFFEPFRYSIHDELGRLIENKTISNSQIDFSNYLNGIYFITFHLNTKSVKKKIVKI